MRPFLEYLQKEEAQEKCLDEENFNYFCKIIEKILELNTNEDIDFDLCNLVLILSSKYYTIDKSKKSGKKYVYEIIRNCPIIQKQGFWVGLAKFKLGMEIKLENIEIIENIIIDILSNLIRDSMKFIIDSLLFNKIVFDIFKYCKIDKEQKTLIIKKIEQNGKNEDINPLILDKDLILSEN